MHATPLQDTPAVVFRSSLFPRLLFVSIRRVSDNQTTALPRNHGLFLFTAFWLAKAFRPGLEQWGALIPQEININTRELRIEVE
jgi:hypothetical protein